MATKLAGRLLPNWQSGLGDALAIDGLHTRARTVVLSFKPNVF